MSCGICNQCLAQMKKLAGFVCLSAVSGPQLSFGSRELPVNKKYVVRLFGQEPVVYVLFFCSLACARLIWAIKCSSFRDSDRLLHVFKLKKEFHLFLTTLRLTLVFKVAKGVLSKTLHVLVALNLNQF